MLEIKFELVDFDAESRMLPGLQISIDDKGVGIPEDGLLLIFDKFSQSSKTKQASGEQVWD